MPAIPRVTHKMKCWPEFFQPTLNALKRFELRRDDRPEGFQVGDELLLKEFDPKVLQENLPQEHRTAEDMELAYQKAYTGREVLVRVDYVMPAKTADRLMGVLVRTGAPGFVIMSISLVN